MVEEIVGKLSAHQLMLEEYGVRRACTLFFTSSRVIVMMPEGINTRVFALAVIALVVGFVGFLLKNFLLFFAGLMAAIVVGLLLGLIDFVIRHRRMSKVKRLAPDNILKASGKNFEISYSDVVKVKHTSFERHEGSSRFFLPTFPELMHDIEFTTSQKRYVFILERNDFYRCMNLLNRFIPEKIEKDENEEF